MVKYILIKNWFEMYWETIVLCFFFCIYFSTLNGCLFFTVYIFLNFNINLVFKFYFWFIIQFLKKREMGRNVNEKKTYPRARGQWNGNEKQMKQFGEHEAKCNKRISNAYVLLLLSCLIRSFQIDPESYPQLFQGN